MRARTRRREARCECQGDATSMRIGYACINTELECRSSRTFRLASYSEERLEETLAQNLSCLQEILRWNLRHGILFFRITSDLVPFGSHEVNTYDWQQRFRDVFATIGDFIRAHGMRVSLHPGQYTLLNSPRPEVVANSVADLHYHTAILDLMELDGTHKVQIHVGGVYGDKVASLERFVRVYQELPQEIRARLVIENDERLYSLSDCLALSRGLGIPVVFDVFHHSILNDGEDLAVAIDHAAQTWRGTDGGLIVDYSDQEPNARLGAHSTTIDIERFEAFVAELPTRNVDVMLEVKDKQASAMRLKQAGFELSRS